MKQKIITPVIKKRFSNIKEYISQMLVNFEEEPVHNFRTEIKKLQAFLRLLNAGHNKDQLSVTKKMKVYYWYAGNIRNLQLHVKSINETEGGKPAVYLKSVKKQVESLQGVLRSLHSPSNFDEPQKMIRNWVAEPGKPSVKKLVYQKIDEFKHLLTLMKQDEILHAIRKLLKDILYNWKYIKEYSSLLPPAISGKKQIAELTVILGEFCDRITGIHILEAYVVATPDPADKEILEKLISKWDTEKNDLRLKVYTMLNYNPA
ncbi:MAG TPA: CHAD domain-containing protein [Chitinophagaceae bacterium]|nr:CHAD domain-containing protein [Chitinophagaceae bacterium]